ncbi:zinc finger protein 653 isoform X1 [Bombina bombina]|uniref:zinc finger protein 653 isoform X1 n=1 Tax=Bombina bombina TaxID=8345 RepID=UPI00235AF643|nr:zinc finger protein 653 isoform X1 [Bombina bombina]
MEAPLSSHTGSEEDDDYGRKVRGRPRLADTDRVKRRLESRKKYDGRRVYLGETHGAWVWRRERGGGGEPWSDARLAAYLLAMEKQGKPLENNQRSEMHRKGQKHCESSLQGLVTWYQDHKKQCSCEPCLSKLDTSHVMCPVAVWQCSAGHSFFQDLSYPIKRPKHRGCDDGASSDSSSSSAPVEQTLEICSETSPPDYPPSTEGESESKEQGTEENNTVVCVPMQEGSGSEEFYEEVSQNELGHVVTAGCPSQVIIIAGPGYEALASEGIHLDVTANSSGDEDDPGTAMEGVSAFTQTDAEDRDWDQRSTGTVIEEEPFYYTVKREPDTEEEIQEPESDIHLSDDTSQGQTETVLVGDQEYETDVIQLIPKESEKKKCKSSRIIDADGLLQMFHCPYEGCNQVYTAVSSFQNHVNLIHRKGRTKVCTEPGCGKRFYVSNHLRRHMIIHTGLREFICETCGKSFKRKNHLEVHRRTHTGETPLQCEVCGYQCRQRSSLNWHMKKHRAEVNFNFSCEYCGKPFEKKESVKFHKLKSHPEKVNP